GSTEGALALACAAGELSCTAFSRSAAQAAGAFTGSGLGTAYWQARPDRSSRIESMRVTMVEDLGPKSLPHPARAWKREFNGRTGPRGRAPAGAAAAGRRAAGASA